KSDLENYVIHLSNAYFVAGSRDEGVALVVDLIWRQGMQTRYGGRVLLRWSWGRAKGEIQKLRDDSMLQPKWLLTRAGDFVELRDGGENERSLELRRYRANGKDEAIVFPQLEKLATAYGVGERENGELWVHYGDHLGFIAPDGSAKSLNIDNLLARH